MNFISIKKINVDVICFNYEQCGGVSSFQSRFV